MIFTFIIFSMLTILQYRRYYHIKDIITILKIFVLDEIWNQYRFGAPPYQWLIRLWKLSPNLFRIKPGFSSLSRQEYNYDEHDLSPNQENLVILLHWRWRGQLDCLIHTFWPHKKIKIDQRIIKIKNDIDLGENKTKWCASVTLLTLLQFYITILRCQHCWYCWHCWHLLAFVDICWHLLALLRLLTLFTLLKLFTFLTWCWHSWHRPFFWHCWQWLHCWNCWLWPHYLSIWNDNGLIPRLCAISKTLLREAIP